VVPREYGKLSSLSGREFLISGANDLMESKAKLIGRLMESHQQIEELVPQVDPNLEIYPGWTISAILAHFTGWDNAAIVSLNTLAAGDVPSVVAEGDHNLHNLISVSEREALSFEQIFQDWQNTHEQLKIAIRDLSPEKMEANFVFPWGQVGNIADLIIGLTADHEAIHMQDVQILLDTQK
jgi:hypothetical protein